MKERIDSLQELVLDPTKFVLATKEEVFSHLIWAFYTIKGLQHGLNLAEYNLEVLAKELVRLEEVKNEFESKINSRA